MTEPIPAMLGERAAADAVERPSPAGALEAAFNAILQRQMRDVPIVNAALAVEAVGFRPWGDHWLGILITPWFMNLMLMPRVGANWKPIGEGESRHCVFPAGVFEFIGGRDATLGDYQACSLFSPMFEFANHTGARDTAVAALDALFERASRDGGDVPSAQGGTSDRPASPGAAPSPRTISKRALLFGLPQRSDRGP